MRVKLTGTAKWSGKTRFRLQPHDPKRRDAVSESVGNIVTTARDPASGESQLTVSLGKGDKVTPDTLRRAGGAIVSWLKEHGVSQAGIEVPAAGGKDEAARIQALAEGLSLRDDAFDGYKSTASKRQQLTADLLVPRPRARLLEIIRRTRHICEGTLLARHLGHEPPNVVNPVTLARRTRAIAKRSGLGCTVLDERKLAQLRMNAILAVGQASATPSRLIVLTYRGRGTRSARPVVLVGKAITFDTGGYSIKPRDGIVGMKYDKCGGMAVIGAMQAVAACNPGTPVIGVIAAAENMIGGDAYRPDDIIKTASGKTVEIVSADAEGRMVLCDAMTYVQRNYKPRCMIDLATLTGGVIIALGNEAAGIFSNDEKLQERLIVSGRAVHERLWPLPLWDDYFELIRGDDSDMKNSAGRAAHAIQGGIFLKQFVDPKIPWAHLDIAGVASVERTQAYCPKGATGFGVRLLLDYILGLS